MFNRKKRGLLASAGALVTAAALVLGGAAAASAAPVTQQPTESTVTIHKRELAEGQTPGAAANGLENSAAPGTPLGGVTFTAYPVTLVAQGGQPLPAAGTNEWQQLVAALTVANVADGTRGVVGTTAAHTGTTNTTAPIGDLVWSNVQRGVYLVKETGTPAGIVPAADFLLTVPLTNPATTDPGLREWLTNIHIYPKNRSQNGVKTVDNATDYKVGDTVEWKIDLPNPSKSRNTENTAWLPTDKFVIFDTIKDEYLTAVSAGVTVSNPAGLANPGDYGVQVVAGTGNTATGGSAHAWQASDGNGILTGYSQVQITFTETGRAALATAKNDNESTANVVATIPTVVNKQGAIKNSAQFSDHSSNTTPKDVPGSEVRYGHINLQKDSTDDTVTGTGLQGAEFRVYLTEAAALAAAGPNWGGAYSTANPNGYLVPTDGPGNGIFVTGATGAVEIGGLRHSNFANGALLTSDADPLWQSYWLVETKALAGHQLLGAPVKFEILGDANGVVPTTPVTVVNSKDGGFQLPLTGGTGTLLLTLLGAGILGAVLVVARRRKNAAAE